MGVAESGWVSGTDSKVFVCLLISLVSQLPDQSGSLSGIHKLTLGLCGDHPLGHSGSWRRPASGLVFRILASGY